MHSPNPNCGRSAHVGRPGVGALETLEDRQLITELVNWDSGLEIQPDNPQRFCLSYTRRCPLDFIIKFLFILTPRPSAYMLWIEA